MSKIKQGDLVTVPATSLNSASNVYRVSRKLEDECVLNHPLYPECHIIRKDSELNLVTPQAKSGMENCLLFIMNNKNFLDYNTIAEVEAIAAYFIINRRLTPRQKKAISSICGKIASIKLENSITLAIKQTVTNAGVLDDFNRKWYESSDFKDVYSGNASPTPRQWNAIFNIAGYVLAQLETYARVAQGGENESKVQETTSESSNSNLR